MLAVKELNNPSARQGVQFLYDEKMVQFFFSFHENICCVAH